MINFMSIPPPNLPATSCVKELVMKRNVNISAIRKACNLSANKRIRVKSFSLLDACSCSNDEDGIPYFDMSHIYEGLDIKTIVWN